VIPIHYNIDYILLFTSTTKSNNEKLINKEQDDMIWYQHKGIQGLSSVQSFDNLEDMEQIND